MNIRTIILLITLCVFSALTLPSGPKHYQELNQSAPFALSVGFSMSQTHQTANTVHPEYARQAIVAEALKAQDPILWLKQHQEHLLKYLPIYECPNCGYQLNPQKINIDSDQEIINGIIHTIAQNLNHAKLTLVKSCPLCHQQNLAACPETEIIFTENHQRALTKQIDYLGVCNQAACTIHHLPTCRISIEAADILQNGTFNIDLEKLKKQNEFLQTLRSPLVFFHHYANPQSMPKLFETEESIEWFVNYCATVIESNASIQYVCPISQPVGFSFHLNRATLPPFTCSVDQTKHLNIIKQAQIAAARKIKTINPNIKILISHQWKHFKTTHGPLHPLYYLEYVCSFIANRMYNHTFITMLQDCQNDFDGIALSIYPGISFNGIKPEGNNCAAYFNEDDAYQSIIATHKAFPNKEIFIVETGCNTQDPEQKKAFIDMTLRVCKRAREQNIKIPGVYLWGITNDPGFYSEWGHQSGKTHFGPYDQLDPNNPCDSINASGLYLKEILQ